MKYILIFFQRYSIRTQLLVGFLILFICFSFQSVFIVSSISNISQARKDAIKNRINSAAVLKIEKNISEIQREALLFTHLGKATIINKMYKIQSGMEDELKRVKLNTIEKDQIEIIEKMQKIVRDYKENIKSLKNRSEILRDIVKYKMPSVFLRGELHFKNKMKKYFDNKTKLILYQNAYTSWILIDRNTKEYIEKREYNIKKEILNSYKEILKNTSGDQDYKKTQKLISSHKDIFNQAVQSNRLFLTLNNVVMAGDSVEFSNLAGRLSQLSSVSLEKKSSSAYTTLKSAKIFIFIIILVTIPVLFFVVYIFNESIATSIKRISQTFDEFIKGNLQEKVPGLDRGDEIGMLAKAATLFRNQNKELKIVTKEALKAKQIKSDFLANMSHEIRTPMNGMLGVVQLLESSELDHEQRKLLEVISSSGKGLLTVLNDILDFSKLEAQKVKIESKPFNLHESIEELSYLYSHEAKLKNIKLTIDIDKAEVPEIIKADITRIKQVLINLVNNALKFTAVGEVIVKVKKITYESNSYIKFIVSDTGIGIEQESLKDLFKAFTQADTSITRKFGGTGLGLTISSKLVNLMGGELSVTSTFGLGSSFSFYVKFEKSELKDLDKHNDFQTKDPGYKGLHMLIAEDNDINFLVLSKMIKKLGHTYQRAVNGKEAVELVTNNKFDLVLMDMQMPVMGGIEATSKIRKYNHDIKIFAITANVMEEDEKKCLDAGMNGFYTKPFSIKDLKNCFKHLY